MSSVNERRMNSRAVDKLGIVASTACAVHCGVSAFVPALLGALGVGALLGHEAEWVFTLVAVAFASIALWLGFRRHRSRRVASILLTGIFGLLAARVIEVGAADHHDSGDHREAYAASKSRPPMHRGMTTPMDTGMAPRMVMGMEMPGLGDGLERWWAFLLDACFWWATSSTPVLADVVKNLTWAE
jgi:hypothetical protein